MRDSDKRIIFFCNPRQYEVTSFQRGESDRFHWREDSPLMGRSRDVDGVDGDHVGFVSEQLLKHVIHARHVTVIGPRETALSESTNDGFFEL